MQAPNRTLLVLGCFVRKCGKLDISPDLAPRPERAQHQARRNHVMGSAASGDIYRLKFNGCAFSCLMIFCPSVDFTNCMNRRSAGAGFLLSTKL